MPKTGHRVCGEICCKNINSEYDGCWYKEPIIKSYGTHFKRILMIIPSPDFVCVRLNLRNPKIQVLNAITVVNIMIQSQYKQQKRKLKADLFICLMIISDGIKRVACGNYKEACPGCVKRLVLFRVGDPMSGWMSGISAHTQGRLMGFWTSFFLQRFPRGTEKWEGPSLKTEVGRETTASAQDRFQSRSPGFYTWFNILLGEFGSILHSGPPHHSHFRSNLSPTHTTWEKMCCWKHGPGFYIFLKKKKCYISKIQYYFIYITERMQCLFMF